MDHKLPKEYKKPDKFKNELYLLEDNQYKSPISLIQSDIETKVENGVFSAIQKVGIDVNKEELVKALQYDRNQYDKGYQNAKAKYDRGHGHWILKNGPDGTLYCFHCSVCDGGFHYIGITTGYDYCPLCGAKMDEEEEDD